MGSETAVAALKMSEVCAEVASWSIAFTNLAVCVTAMGTSPLPPRCENADKNAEEDDEDEDDDAEACRRLPEEVALGPATAVGGG